jgi:hypothetical protein
MLITPAAQNRAAGEPARRRMQRSKPGGKGCDERSQAVHLEIGW